MWIRKGVVQVCIVCRDAQCKREAEYHAIDVRFRKHLVSVVVVVLERAWQAYIFSPQLALNAFVRVC